MKATINDKILTITITPEASLDILAEIPKGNKIEDTDKGAWVRVSKGERYEGSCLLQEYSTDGIRSAALWISLDSAGYQTLKSNRSFEAQHGDLTIRIEAPYNQ